MVITVVDRVVDSDVGYSLKYLFQHQYNFLLLLQDRQTVLLVNTATNTQLHEHFLHLFGEEFLDALIAETNLLEEKILSKVYLSVGNLSVIKNFYGFNN